VAAAVLAGVAPGHLPAWGVLAACDVMRVSVIIPCYNAARFIGETLQSVLSQTHVDTCAIVVDDRSTDGTADIVERFGPRVTMIRQHQQGGVSAARNAALAIADGEAVAFLDGDDRWHPEKIARQVAYLEAHPECGVVHTAVRHINDAGDEIPRPGGAIPWRIAAGDCLGDLLMHNTITTSTVLVRRAALGADRFPEDLRVGEDWDLWLRLAARTEFGYLGDPLTDYRIHDSNTTRNLERVLTARLAVIDRALTRGLNFVQRRAAMGHRQWVLAGLGHLAYDRGDLPQARTLFRRAGRHLDRVGVMRLIALSTPSFVREPIRDKWKKWKKWKSGKVEM
jgi:glycosyltransferase involved in cell wall biosynthesis